MKDKKKRLQIWIYASVASGLMWGIWKGGVIQGLIYGCMVFLAALTYEGYLSLRNRDKD